MKRFTSGTALSFVGYVLLVPIALVPLLWAVLGAFRPTNEFFRVPPAILPSEWTFDAFVYLASRTRIFAMLWNSVFVTSASTLLTLIVASVAAYGFSRWDVRYKNLVLVGLLVCQIMPAAETITPLYLMMHSIGLTDSHLGLILLLSASHSPLAIWIMKAQFDSLPVSMDEAALIDGASRLRILVTILLPVALPGVGAAAALTFIGVWAEFLVPIVIGGAGDSAMITAGIYGLFGQDTATYFNRLFAAAVIAAAPVVIVYLLAQKQFVSGLTAGADR